MEAGGFLVVLGDLGCGAVTRGQRVHTLWCERQPWAPPFPVPPASASSSRELGFHSDARFPELPSSSYLEGPRLALHASVTDVRCPPNTPHPRESNWKTAADFRWAASWEQGACPRPDALSHECPRIPED